MATWLLNAQLTDGTTLAVNSTDHIWLNGTNFSTQVTVGQYQDTTHISDVNDVERCTSIHPHNTKFVDGTHVSIDGAGSQVLAAGGSPVPSTAQAPLVFNFSDPSSVATSAAKFYAYDGATDANPMAGITFQAIECAQSTSWTAANGSGAALTLQNQGAATSHNFYIGLSASPTATGAKTGNVKITLTYA